MRDPATSTFAALLVALGMAGCSDEKLVAPEAPVADNSVPGAVAEGLLQDPLVNLLLASLKDRTGADAIRVALGSLAAGAGPLPPALLAREPETDTENVVAIAALALLFDHAADVQNTQPQD